MSENFCKGCGNPLQTGNDFCPKCGRPVNAPPSSVGAKGFGRVGGIDKRYLIGIAVILIILLIPIFPREKTIYVSGQTTTTELYQSTSFQTSFQAYPSISQTTVQVYVGTLQYVSSQYYSYYSSYYGGCYRGYYGVIRCGGYYNWPNYNSYTSTVTINPSDNVMQMSSTASGYLSTVTLTKTDGSVVTYTNVFNNNLAQSGTSTVTVTVTATSTVTQTTMVPATTVTSVACDNCVPQQVTEHVSLLQLLLGI